MKLAAVRMLLIGVALGGVVAAQVDPAGRFDAAYTSACDGGGSWAGAARAFLRLSPESPDYRGRLAAGAHALLESGDVGRAGELAAARLAVAPADPLAGWVRLVVILDRDGAAAALRTIAPALVDDAAVPQAVDRFLVTGVGRAEGALFRAALGALRAGEVELGLPPLARVARLLEDVARGGDVAARHSAALVVANHALALRQLGRLPVALERYGDACALWPEDDVLWSDRGLARKAAGDAEGALLAFAASLERESAAAAGPAVTNLGVLARRVSGERLDRLQDLARQLLRRNAEESPQKPATQGFAADPVVAMLELAVDVRPKTELRRRLLVDAVVPRR